MSLNKSVTYVIDSYTLAFFWFLFLAKQEKELAAGLPPANSHQYPNALAP
jgi:hypothetical protein